METKQKTPEGKTGAEIVLEWMRKYSEQNGTPTEFEIRCQLELAIDAEKLHHQEANAGQTKELEKYSAIEKAVEIASKNVTAPKVVREGIVTPISEQSEPVSLDLLSILEGIDKTDSEGGWWDTSVGAEFGKNKLKELQILFDKSQQPASVAFLSEDEIQKQINWLYTDGTGFGNNKPEHKEFAKGVQYCQSELRKRVIDPVDLLNWITTFESHYEGDGGYPDKIRCFDAGWFWESDRDGDCELSPKQIIEIYINSKTK